MRLFVTNITCLGQSGISDSERNMRMHYMRLSCALFVMFTSLTWVSDYKHHAEDLASGALLGFMASLTVMVRITSLMNQDGLKCI